MVGRRCPGRYCPVILTGGERYCPTHAREYETRRGSSTARGYDTQHDRLRAAWQRRMDSGETVTCATCPTVLNGGPWDLGHGADRATYLGPQCLPCNRGEGGRRGNAIRRMQ